MGRRLTGPVVHKLRQFRLSVRHNGLRSTLYWAVFGYLRANRFLVLARPLDGPPAPGPEPVAGATFEIWDGDRLRLLRAGRAGLSWQFYQDEIDGADTCAVALLGGEVVGLAWIYGGRRARRLFELQDDEAELNHVYVPPAYRGRGLMKPLVACACSWLASQGYRAAYAAVHSTNIPSQRGFLGAGFVVAGSIRRIGAWRPKFSLARGGEPGRHPARREVA